MQLQTENTAAGYRYQLLVLLFIATVSMWAMILVSVALAADHIRVFSVPWCSLYHSRDAFCSACIAG